jgi:hypothetical protein
VPDFAVRTSFNAVDKISPAFRQMGAEADKFGRKGAGAFGRLNSASSRLAGAFRGLLPAISAGLVLKFANDSISAWKQHEAAVAMVEARIKSTNNALGLTSKQLQESASTFQKVGIFGDETILKNLTSQLMTFGNIGKENFDRVQTAALDVTAQLRGVTATGNDLQSTAIMLGKALDDPARGMAALRRVGITLNDQEVALIKSMQKSGDTLGAQNKLLSILEKQYGGTNEELGKTAEGMELIARNKMGDAMKQIGKALVPFRAELFNIVSNAMPYLVAAMPAITASLKVLIPTIAGVIVAMALWKIGTYAVIAAQKIMMAAGWIKYLWMMRAAIFKAVTMTKAWAVAQKILNFILIANPIGLIIMGIAALIAIGVVLYKNWDIIKEKFLAAGSAILDGVKMIGRGIITWFMIPVNLLMTGIAKMLELASNIPGVGDKLAKAAASVRDFQAKTNANLGSTNLLAGGERTAPNETQLKSQSVRMQGEININGAPSGSTASAKTRGGRVDMNLVGANP